MEFRVLGPVQLGPPDDPIPLRGHRRRGLLAALLLRANQPVSTAELIQTLWAEPTRAAESNVRTQVAQLRRLLDDPERLETLSTGYRLTVAPDELDLTRFDRLTGAADTALRAGDAGRAVELLSAARALWRGRALDGTSTSPALTAAADRLEERRLAAVEQWARALIADGRAAEAVPELRTLVVTEPVRERSAALLMTALSRAGEPAAALTVYERVRVDLAERLGTDPAPDLQRLYEQLLRGEADPAPAEQPHGGRPVPRQLPARPIAFTGRSDEQRRLDELARPDGGGNVVVLAGTAGVGKTALALRWAASAAERFGDGQLYANLRGFGPTEPVPAIETLTRFLGALGVSPESIPPDPEEAAALYRSLVADRRMLVVLDNAADEEQVRPLLPGGPDCVVLVTSRRRLRGLVVRDGARLVDVGVLPEADAVRLLATLSGRTEAPPVAGQGGAPGQGGAGELSALARECGRLPLALRIAAANLADEPTLPVPDYLARLRTDRLGALRIDGDPDSVVGAAFDHSYQRLSEPDAAMFRLLGAAPVTEIGTGAAAALAGTDEAEAAARLGRLAAAHLVERVGPDRYGMHDLLREYAARRAGSETAAVGRLLDWYLGRLHEVRLVAHPDIVPLTDPPLDRSARPLDRAAAVRWIGAEADNVVTLIRYAAAHGPYPASWRLAERLRGHLLHTQHMVSWMAIVDTVSAAAEAADDAEGRAVAGLMRGDAHRWACRLDAARSAYQVAAEQGQLAELPGVVTLAHQGLGSVAIHGGQMAVAEAHLRTAYERYQRAGSSAGQAAAASNLTIALTGLGKLAEARALVERCAELFAELGFELGAVVTQTNLADISVHAGDLRAARGQYRSALDELRADDNTLNVATEPLLLARLAEVDAELGDLDRAVPEVRLALQAAHRVAEPVVMCEALLAAGATAWRRGDPAAVQRYAEAIRVARENEITDSETRALAGMARAEAAAGRGAAAMGYAATAVRLARTNAQYVLLPPSLLALAESALAVGDRATAASAATEAAEAYRGLGDERRAAKAAATARAASGGTDR